MDSKWSWKLKGFKKQYDAKLFVGFSTWPLKTKKSMLSYGEWSAKPQKPPTRNKTQNRNHQKIVDAIQKGN